ncbi:MAG TPA: DUF1294 domain-containing protein [Candidatus Magasanikbacteria bacterium]|nr:DUF1294 domain-containing protein [Candidatus Magasanikbacteria bacterium]
MFFIDFYNSYPWLIWYLVIINLVTFFVYGLDKAKAEGQSWRVKETKLLLLAFIGGTIGAIAGMKIFRHKTKKVGFLLPFVLILALQIAIFYFFLTKTNILL